MTHPLVKQLRFARSEWQRGLEGVSLEEGKRRFEPMNCISWMIGHLANQEQRYWLEFTGNSILSPELAQFGFGNPASTPNIDDTWNWWHQVTSASNAYLETLTTATLEGYWEYQGKPMRENIGTMMYRMIHHYWFHLGEGMAVRQLLGHTDLPQFVGNMSSAGYEPH